MNLIRNLKGYIITPSHRFDDTELPITSEHDSCLTTAYGDDMKRPDREENPEHHISYYWK